MADRQQQRRTQKAQQAQLKAQINRDKARQKLLQQRKKLARRRKKNQQKCQSRQAEAAEGRSNPTARSTLSPQRSNEQNAAQHSHSTVPPTPKYSSVAARDRLYGLRLHRRTTKFEGPDATESESVDAEQADE